LNASALSHHGLSWEAFITNIAGSDFRYAQAKPSTIVVITPTVIVAFEIAGPSFLLAGHGWASERGNI
jgi:hypothetical protein